MPRAFLVRKGLTSLQRRSPVPSEENNNFDAKKRIDSESQKSILEEITSHSNVVKSETRKPGLHQPFLPDVEPAAHLVAQTPSRHTHHSGGQGDPMKPSNRSPTGSPSEPPTVGDLWAWWRQRVPGITQSMYPSLLQQSYSFAATLHPNIRDEYNKTTADYNNLREHIMNAANYRDTIRYDSLHPCYRYPTPAIPYPYSGAQSYNLLPSPPNSRDDPDITSQKSPMSSLFPWSIDNNHHVAEGDSPKRLYSVESTTPDVTEKKRKRDPEVAPRYQCEDCNKSYSTLSGLSKHKQFHCSSQIQKQFTCKYCEKAYVSLGALKMHIRTHTLPCKCHLCGKAFSRPWLLQGHIRTHTGERPFTCPHCGRAFADRSNLRAHLQTHSEIKKYSCTTCSKTFSRMSLLLKHQDGGCAGA